MSDEVPRHQVLAEHTADTVTVYQAHSPELAAWALEHQRFGGAGWRTDRLTRVRTSFLGLAYRTALGRRPSREVLLRIELTSAGFESLMRQAVRADFSPSHYQSQAAWRLATRYAAATVEWVDDVDAAGKPMHRKRARFGLRAAALAPFSKDWLVSIADMSPLVTALRDAADPFSLTLPAEVPYSFVDPALASRLRERG